MKYHHSQNCALNSPTMFRNICVLALVVLCGQAASAFSMDMVMGMVTKIGGKAVSMGMDCLTKNKATDVMSNPTPQNVARGCGCIAGCALQTVGMMSADGKVQTGIIEKFIPESMPMGDKIKQVLKDCSSKGGDVCHAPLAWAKCMCTDGPMKEIMTAMKGYATKLVMEIVKSAM